MPVPQPTFTDAGFQSPTELDVLVGVTADIVSALGGNVNPSPATPQGQLAATEAAAIAAVNDLFTLFAAQSDPAFAQGRMQDAIARIYFIERNPALPSVVQAVCIGAAGAKVQAGLNTFVDPSGLVWVCQQSGTFSASGKLILSFVCSVPGPTTLPANAAVRILSGSAGWDTVSLAADAVPGTLVEGRAAFERRRALSVAVNALGSLGAVRGAVLTVAGVIDAFVTENALPTAQLIGGVSVAANSVYVCAAGGAPADVALAIFRRKAPGCGYNGDTTVQVQDTQAGLSAPYPTYAVTYQTARPLSILVSVTIAASTAVPSNANVLIQNAVIAAFAGLDGGPRASIGTAYLASRLYAPVAALGAWAQIVDILVGSPTALPATSFAGSISGNTLTVTALAQGAGPLAVGQTLDDLTGAVADGTRVVGFGTGTGGAGTYALSGSQTVAQQNFYGGTASAYRVPVTIAQIPVASAVDVQVATG